MKNFTYKFNAAVVSLALLTAVGCSKEELSYTDVDENDVVENAAAKTSGGSCSTAVNFRDLEVETSYDTGATGNRDQYAACGVDGEPWMDRYTDNRVKLQCLQGDGHRTELKEDTGDEANLTNYKKMMFTAKYTSLPSHGVTIAQVHNRANGIKRPWLRLYIDSDGKFKIKETKTTPWANSSTYATYTGMAYTSNQNVKITLITGIGGKGRALIRVDYNGQRFQKHLTPRAHWNNYANSYYLKAGVYTEGTDKEARVTYSAFQIVH